MKYQPLISIAMATYNGETFLKQQIESILCQTYKNIELIICDDMSTDNTVQIVEEYMKIYDCIKLYKNKTNLGFVKNFEKAIEFSSGDFIALADQDDIWDINKLEIYIDEIIKIEKNYINLPIMVHSDLTTVSSNGEIINDSYFKFRNYTFSNKRSIGTMLGPCGVMGNTILFNKELKNYILPFPEMLAFHDYWIALVNELFGKRVTIHNSLVKYRLHETNSSNSMDNISKKKSFNNSIKTLLNREFVLPYRTEVRKKTVEDLLERFKLIKEDKSIVEIFIKYLNMDINRFLIAYYLIKYDYIKRGFRYRFSIIFKLLFIKNI